MNMAVTVSKTKAEQEITDNFASVSGKLPGGEWVQKLRADAMVAFEAEGLPHRRIEDWKYTDLRAKLQSVYSPSVQSEKDYSDQAIRDKLGPLANLDATTVLVVDGKFRSINFAENMRRDEIEVLPLEEAVVQAPDWFREEFGQVNQLDSDPVSRLNTAFMSGGVALRVKDGLVLEPAIHIVFVTTGKVSQSCATRNFLIIGNSAQVTILESHIALGDAPSQSLGVTELVVTKSAKVDHLKLQNESSQSTHLSTWMTRVEEEANYNAFQFSVGAALSRNQIFVRFAGEGARLNISGACILNGTRHCDTTLVVDHAVPHCESRELFKFVLDDQARGVFQGKIIVRPDAQKTDGEQMSQALLLSEQAEFDSKPELEIFADDVVCGHGATSGQIDEDLLFYLMARGLPEHEARALLVTAFIGDALEVIDHEAIREAFTEISNAILAAS